MKRKQIKELPEKLTQRLEAFLTLFRSHVPVFPQSAYMVPQGFAAITSPRNGCLATTDVQSCIAVVFFNPDNRRIGLLHFDSATTETSFQHFFASFEFESHVYYGIIGANRINEDFFSDVYDGDLLFPDRSVSPLSFSMAANEKQTTEDDCFLVYAENLYGIFEQAIRHECSMEATRKLTREDLLRYAKIDCPATFNVFQLSQFLRSLRAQYPKLQWHNGYSIIHHNKFSTYETVVINPDDASVHWCCFPRHILNPKQYLQYFALNNATCDTVLMYEIRNREKLEKSRLKQVESRPRSPCDHIEKREALLEATIAWLTSGKACVSTNQLFKKQAGERSGTTASHSNLLSA